MSLVFATFSNNALHWYTQFQTYPLFAWVGKQEFRRLHGEYERRLSLALYVPYGLLMVSNVLLLAFRPPEIGTWTAIALLLLNASVAVVSLLLAVPVHRRLDREAPHHAPGDLDRLVRLNALRLAAATISSALVLYALARVIAT